MYRSYVLRDAERGSRIGTACVCSPRTPLTRSVAGSTLDGRDPLKDAVVSYGMQVRSAVPTARLTLQAPLPPIRLTLHKHTYLVVKARKGTGPIIEALEKGKRRKATSFPPCTMRVQGPAGGGNYAGTLLVQLGEPGTEDEHRGRLTRDEANQVCPRDVETTLTRQCGQWLMDQRAITSFEIYRPDMLLDAEPNDLSRQDTAATYDTYATETQTLRYEPSVASHEPLVK